MKKLFAKIKKVFTDFFKWLWTECRDVKTLILFGIVCLAVSAPIWIGYILGYVFEWQAAFWFATAMWAFWLLPGAPFFAVAVAITLGIKKLFQYIAKKRKKDSADATAPEAQTGETDTDTKE